MEWGGMGNDLESLKFFGSREDDVKRENERCFQRLTNAEKWLAEPEVSLFQDVNRPSWTDELHLGGTYLQTISDLRWHA